MEKNYNHNVEEEIYKKWEESGVFEPNSTGKPYTILMPPPNANASLHAGHAMYTVDDILIRWKRMQGYSVNWIPGMDHAGFETQFVYEKHLAKNGKSRLDFDRQTLYDDVYKFVQDNSGTIYKQFKRLGFSANWKKSVFTLDKHVIDQVYETFAKMEKEGKVYRDLHIVNYCTYCGTSLAELEVENEERVDPLYYVKYKVLNSEEFVVVATTRPEPIWVDTHLAVNPKDKENKHLISKQVVNPITGATMEIIGDDFVDSEFGTGIVKLTPAHDATDFEVAKKYNLPIKIAIDATGRLTGDAGKYAGLKVKQARETIVADLIHEGRLERIDEQYNHSVKVCYKCKRDLEPMVVPNWFINVSELKKPVINSVTKDEVRFFPKRFKKQMVDWLKIMHDWPISRQVVWGIRIPVWYGLENNPDLEVTTLVEGKKMSGKYRMLLDGGLSQFEIESGLQTVRAGRAAKYLVSPTRPGEYFLQETDTFDTWFSSGQWPLVTMGSSEKQNRLPTDTMGTLADILKFWVSRMIMFSLYIEGKVPFRNVYLWSMVADAKGQKMSKSKGNVVNPIEFVDKYGADALRMALVYGVAPGSKVPLSEEKVKGMRNFANKVWNVARFANSYQTDIVATETSKEDKWITSELNKTIAKATQSLERYRFGDAAEAVYDFIWHKLADDYIEKIKGKKTNEAKETLLMVVKQSLKLLHPFMPFVTEAIWREMDHSSMLISNEWPS
jgi:valyl-tRNA synthetase